jgi:hypothetical protein
MLSALLRAGHSLTVGLSCLSTADSILMSYQILAVGGLCYDTPHIEAMPLLIALLDKTLESCRQTFIRENFRLNPLQRGLGGTFAFYRHLSSSICYRSNG